MRTGGTHSEFWFNPLVRGQGGGAPKGPKSILYNVVMLHIKSKVMKNVGGGGGGGEGGGGACLAFTRGQKVLEVKK